MTTILNTYDPNHESYIDLFNNQRISFIDNVKSEAIKQDVPFMQLMDSPQIREFLNLINLKAVEAELSQFKTLEDCISHHEEELFNHLSMEHENYLENGVCLSAEEVTQRFTKLFESFLSSSPDTSKLSQEPNLNFRPLPEAFCFLCSLNNKDSLSSAGDVYKQFRRQDDRLEEDFKRIINNQIQATSVSLPFNTGEEPG